MHALREFLSFLFSRQRRVVHIRAVKRTAAKPDSSANEANTPIEIILKHLIVLIVTYVMSIVLVISLMGILTFLLLYREVPVLLHDMFFGTLGYFGGAFVTFLKSREE